MTWDKECENFLIILVIHVSKFLMDFLQFLLHLLTDNSSYKCGNFRVIKQQTIMFCLPEPDTCVFWLHTLQYGTINFGHVSLTNTSINTNEYLNNSVLWKY